MKQNIIYGVIAVALICCSIMLKSNRSSSISSASDSWIFGHWTCEMDSLNSSVVTLKTDGTWEKSSRNDSYGMYEIVEGEIKCKAICGEDFDIQIESGKCLKAQDGHYYHKR